RQKMQPPGPGHFLYVVLVWFGEIFIGVQGIPPGWLDQTDHVPQQRTFSRATAAHDDKDIPMIDGEVEIAHEHEAAERHREVFYGDVRLMFSVRARTGHVSS